MPATERERPEESWTTRSSVSSSTKPSDAPRDASSSTATPAPAPFSRMDVLSSAAEPEAKISNLRRQDFNSSGDFKAAGQGCNQRGGLYSGVRSGDLDG